MPFAELENFLNNNLAGNVANYLNNKSANFNNVANYYNGNDYFNEHTVQCAMFQCINQWIVGSINENENHYLVRAEVQYPNHGNRADLWITYDEGAGAGPRNIAIELKTNFNADSVDGDIDLLDAMAGQVNPPFNLGYAFYTVQVGDANWANNIADVTQPNMVSKVAINVVF